MRECAEETASAPKLFRRGPSTEGRTAATRRPARGRDGSVELVAEAEVGYPLASLDEIRIKRPSLEPLRRRFKAIAVYLHGNSFRLGVNNERGRTAALGKMRLDERGKTAALKMKTPRSYSDVLRWELAIMKDAAKLPRPTIYELV